MSVYVDNMCAQYGYMKMCHMVADTLEELHAMADKIGVQRRWFQNKRKDMPHYDICKAKRKLAVKHGAIEIDVRETVVILKKRYRNAKPAQTKVVSSKPKRQSRP